MLDPAAHRKQQPYLQAYPELLLEKMRVLPDLQNRRKIKKRPAEMEISEHCGSFVSAITYRPYMAWTREIRRPYITQGRVHEPGCCKGLFIRTPESLAAWVKNRRSAEFP